MERIAYLRIRNWEKYQHYKDRNPAWIKLHSEVLENYEFNLLSDAERYHAVAIMLLASRTSNKIPNDNKWVGNRIGAKTKVNLENLISVGFLTWYDDDSESVAQRLQGARPEERRGEKRREEENAHKTNGFDAFWKIYPRKVGKGAARTAWEKIKPSKKLQTLISSRVGVHSNSHDWTKDDGQYVPNPATYLNQERWEDDLTKQKSTGGTWDTP